MFKLPLLIGLIFLSAFIAACGSNTPTSTPSNSSPNSFPTSNAKELNIASQNVALAAIKPAPIQPDGSIGFNKDGWHTIAEQRRMTPLLLQGLVKNDTATVSLVITSMEFAFNHQNSDGSFQVVQIPGTPAFATFDPVGVAFFYADLGHSLSLLSQSSWFETNPSNASLRSRLNSLSEKISKGLTWLTGSDEMAALEKTGQSGTNRWTFGVNALMLTGQWVHNDTAINDGLKILQMVLASETKDGVLPENKGFDSSYQGVSLSNMVYLYLDYKFSDAATKNQVLAAFTKGIDRENQAINISGQIVTAGDSRVYCGGEQFRGKAKGGEYRDVVISFFYASAITGNPQLEKVAQSVASYYGGTKGGPAHC